MKKLKLMCLSLSLVAPLAFAANADVGVAWEKDLTTALKISKAKQQLMLVDFYAEWCGPCKRMEKTTYADPRVIRQLKKYVAVKVDIDQDQNNAQKYGGNPLKYKGEGIPATMIIDGNGKVVAKVHGYLSADKLIQLLESVKTAPAQLIKSRQA